MTVTLATLMSEDSISGCAVVIENGGIKFSENYPIDAIVTDVEAIFTGSKALELAENDSDYAPDIFELIVAGKPVMVTSAKVLELLDRGLEADDINIVGLQVTNLVVEGNELPDGYMAVQITEQIVEADSDDSDSCGEECVCGACLCDCNAEYEEDDDEVDVCEGCTGCDDDDLSGVIVGDPIVLTGDESFPEIFSAIMESVFGDEMPEELMETIFQAGINEVFVEVMAEIGEKFIVILDKAKTSGELGKLIMGDMLANLDTDDTFGKTLVLATASEIIDVMVDYNDNVFKCETPVGINDFQGFIACVAELIDADDLAPFNLTDPEAEIYKFFS